MSNRPTHSAEPGGKGLGSVTQDEFSISATVGGVRGVVEAILPGLLFVVIFMVTRTVLAPVIAAAAAALILAVWRLAAREPLTQVFSGLVGVGIGAVWAYRSGDANDYFTWGLIVNAISVVVLLLSIVVRWPLVGIFVGALTGQLAKWRENKVALRAYTISTWVFFALFAVRLAVQLPLYLAGQTAALGVAKLAMGLPLFALCVWIVWIQHKAVTRAGRSESDDPESDRPDSVQSSPVQPSFVQPSSVQSNSVQPGSVQSDSEAEDSSPN